MRPTIVLAGRGQHHLAARLLGVDLPDPAPAAYLVLRLGKPSTRAFIPGHRVPRDAGASNGPLTRPPRRVAVSATASLLNYAHLVIAPDEPPTSAATTVLSDAVRCADGLVYLLDAGEALAPEQHEELAELAAVAGRMLLVDTRANSDSERAAVARDLPGVGGARWHQVDDVAEIAAEMRTGHWLAAGGVPRPDATARADGAGVPTAPRPPRAPSPNRHPR